MFPLGIKQGTQPSEASLLFYNLIFNVCYLFINDHCETQRLLNNAVVPSISSALCQVSLVVRLTLEVI